MRDLGVTFDQFIILQLYVEAHIFIFETLEKLGIYYRIMLVLLLFMHLLVVDYCNYLLYNVPMHKTDRMKRLQNQCARILTTSPRREHITPVLKTYIDSNCRIESHIKYYCFHINYTTLIHQLIYIN